MVRHPRSAEFVRLYPARQAVEQRGAIDHPHTSAREAAAAFYAFSVTPKSANYIYRIANRKPGTIKRDPTLSHCVFTAKKMRDPAYTLAVRKHRLVRAERTHDAYPAGGGR